MTKHLPINADGTNDLIKIETRLGRTATATKAKSFLTRVDNEIVPIRGDALEVGMCVPIVLDYPEFPGEAQITHLDMSQYCSKNEYIYTSEIEKARKFRTIMQAEHGPKAEWFDEGNGKVFTLPDSWSDSIANILDNYSDLYKMGCVYPNQDRKITVEIPEFIPLDKEFGFFLGSFLANGFVTDTQVFISKPNKTYLDRVNAFFDSYKIGHYSLHDDKITTKISSERDTMTIGQSVLLARFLLVLCGTSVTFIPEWVFRGPIEFRAAVISGYFSGIKNVREQLVCSIYERIIDELMVLLSQFKILTKKGIPEYNNLSADTSMIYTLTICNDSIKRFGEITALSINHSPSDVIDYLIIESRINSEIYDDEVIGIKSIKPTHSYVYDLTVEKDLTFGLSTNILVSDTFHFSGIGSKGTASLGVPRVKELLHFSKEYQDASYSYLS